MRWSNGLLGWFERSEVGQQNVDVCDGSSPVVERGELGQDILFLLLLLAPTRRLLTGRLTDGPANLLELGQIELRDWLPPEEEGVVLAA